MSHNTRVRADYAAWAIGTGVSAAEFEKFDANLFKAINGDEGGTWAPSSVIDIGGAGVQVESFLTVGADGVFVSRCNSHLEGQVFCQSGILIYNTGTLTVQGAASFTGPFSADGSVTIGGNASVDTLNVTATQTYNGPETHNGTETHNGAVTVNGLATATAGFASTGITALGNNSTVDKLNVQAIQTYAGAETHSGTESHSGVETHTGSVSFATDSIRDTYQEVTSAIDVTLTYTSQHINVVTMTAGGNAVRLTAPAGNSSRSKVIKNPASAAYSFQVIDSSTSTQLANLSPGQECTVITTTTRWI